MNLVFAGALAKADGMIALDVEEVELADLLCDNKVAVVVEVAQPRPLVCA